MYICAECFNTFKRAERKVNRETYEEEYRCPMCGSDNIEYIGRYRKDDADAKDASELER